VGACAGGAIGVTTAPSSLAVRSRSDGYCDGSPRASADRTMRAPVTTSMTDRPPSDRPSFAPLRPSTLFADSTRMPLVDPLSVTHHAPLSSQISQ